MKSLVRTRTVRLSKETDRRIEARAAARGRTASDLIRETLEAEFANTQGTAGEWIIKSARQAPNRAPDQTFARAYGRRHS